MKGRFNMKNTTHRVVILNNLKSELVSQAILVLKNSAEEGDSKLIAEAEKIVEKYMCDTQKNPKKKNPQRRLASVLCIGIILLGAGVFAVLKFI